MECLFVCLFVLGTTVCLCFMVSMQNIIVKNMAFEAVCTLPEYFVTLGIVHRVRTIIPHMLSLFFQPKRYHNLRTKRSCSSKLSFLKSAPKIQFELLVMMIK